VHEAYLRLVQFDRMTPKSRSHFFDLAARLMRQILVDHACRKRSDKRGGAVTVVGFDEVTVAATSNLDVLDLDRALEEVTSFDARLCRVVELRYFGGLTLEETATALEVPRATVERDWALAKAWLHQRLSVR
jgi:RNA polymerase sigma factor (TIGR02999 family)